MKQRKSRGTRKTLKTYGRKTAHGRAHVSWFCGRLEVLPTFFFLLLQEENEIPTTVFVKSPPPFPRDDNLEEDEPPAPGVSDGRQEPTFRTIDLSSDEDVGLEADLEEEDMWPQDLEHLEQSKTEKLKRSSMKRVKALTGEQRSRCSSGHSGTTVSLCRLTA